jgi:hypothetical protein
MTGELHYCIMFNDSDENLKKAIIYFLKKKFRKDKKYEKMMHGISFMESTMNQISIV